MLDLCVGIGEGDDVAIVSYFDAGDGFDEGNEECGIGGRAGIDEDRPTAKGTILASGEEGIAAGGELEIVNRCPVRESRRNEWRGSGR